MAKNIAIIIEKIIAYLKKTGHDGGSNIWIDICKKPYCKKINKAENKIPNIGIVIIKNIIRNIFFIIKSYRLYLN